MKWLKKLIRSIVIEEIKKEREDHQQTIEGRKGTWYQGTPENIVDSCCFEIQYNRKINSYRLRCTGHNPERHTLYSSLAIAVAELNANNIDMKEAVEAVKSILKT